MTPAWCRGWFCVCTKPGYDAAVSVINGPYGVVRARDRRDIEDQRGSGRNAVSLVTVCRRTTYYLGKWE